jgi:D-sedoheptulose 7-phosphate isomerase
VGKELFQSYISRIDHALDTISLNELETSIKIISNSSKNSGKIWLIGNGGSAATASHFATDLSRCTGENRQPITAISLCDNLGLITAYSNDLDYGQIFSGQLKCILNRDDLLICISGSGNSKNVVNAAKYANEQGAETLCLVGYDGGELKKICKYNVHVPSFDMQICEDIHLMIGHMIMKKLCGSVIN